MAGRFIGWHHKKGRGRNSPEDLAAARKVLGALENELKLGGVQSGARKVLLPSGTLVEAAITMGQPSVRITPRRGGQRLVPARELGEFITVPRSAARPNGVDPDYPEVMLRHATDLWRSYFYGSPPPGFAGDGGTYTDMFPKGLGQGGNADWVGPDGERLSWYGPSSRAFVDAYVNPVRQLGKQVFYLGEVLLDTDDYLARSPTDPGFTDRYVAGAALRRIGGTFWLYVVQTTAEPGITPPPVPYEEGAYGFFSYPLALQSGQGGLHRYRLLADDDTQGLVRLRVIAGSRQKLLTFNAGSGDPWFFDKTCSEAVCHPALPPPSGEIPGKPWWVASVPSRDNPPDEDDVGPEDEYHPPATQGVRLRLVIGDESASGQSIIYSLVSGGSAVPVTADYDLATNLLYAYGIRFGADLVPRLVFDNLEVKLFESTVEAGEGTEGGDLVTGLKRWVLYANPRDHVVVLLRLDVEYDTGADPTLVSSAHVIEVYVDGELVHEQTVAETDEALAGLVVQWGDSSDHLDDLEGRNLSPQFFVYGLVRTFFNTAEDGLPGSWRSAATYVGCNPMFAQHPYPAACWFGIADAEIPFGEESEPIADTVEAGFNGNVPDANGNFSVTGAARHLDAVIVSCWHPREGMNTSFTWVTSGSLESMTTVGGARARYHPIRLLGKMPLEDQRQATD